MSVTRQWFQPGEGIAREVITADIQRYLGNDALVRPGEGTGEYQGVQGYWITAYRNLTSQMVADLKLDSQRWRTEVSQGRVSYQDSRTHQSRQYYGPSDPAPAPAAVPYQQPSRPAYPPQPTHQSHQQYQQPEPSYTYAQPQPQAAYAAPAGQAYQQPPYNQAQGQLRTQPNYTYTQQSASQDQHAQYAQHQDPRYTYPQQAATAPPTQSYQVPPQPRYYGFFHRSPLVYR
ncbi:uncharacterized protein BDZ99DRAFT_468214 [Mytilinidion resinicola]|uniref:Uncharacterized protein n=1 Tax=Mytilinidion resinicola TaxID=574789 RepID=A0A6A6Y333_9PEZI|nr:uncharacterized protein BDZ99DRAFT_468214 [Mytilinidion resinicola]KAF2803231.1 hypothetical protein BDZ99DRAFT_468214 [Mytilinidion resinicola]